MKRLTVLLCFWFAVLGVRANNVRIIEDAKIGNLENGYAELTFTIAWDNSWRDDYNWDAVYVFMKAKRTTDLEWKHTYFMEDGHVMSAGYDCWPGRYSSTDNYRQGVFIYRKTKGKGDAVVSATLHWYYAGSGFSVADLQSEAMEMSLQCIEMVYVPMGPYYLGDGVSKNTFRKKFRQILPEWDLINSHDPSQKFTASAPYGANVSVSGPANRVSEAYASWTVASGNIYFTTAGESYWQVEFAEPKTVRYFGVSGLNGYGTYRPSSWSLWASKNGEDNWQAISKTYSANEWPIELLSYPVYNALPVIPESVGAYRFYRIKMSNPSYGSVINNVALTEKDLSQVTDDGFTVDGQHMQMNATTGLFAEDGDSWSGTFSGTIESNGTRNTTKVYPSGFEGFYAMKYEISQEQYVRFLNKLNATQQKARTREDLDQLEEGEYVFGTHRDRPNCRNGIVVGARSNGVAIFACDLNPDGRVSQEDDGQTVACNYLSVNDMLAYADWAGLRPLSEMEYEKMGRRPYPQAPDARGWAGGVRDLAELPTGEVFAPRTTKGGIDERLIDGNLNAGGKVSGPVRVGSYASGAQVPSEAGASYWGVMDLSGNLAEYYYNAGSTGRGFGDAYYGYCNGDGALDANGEANIHTSYWPRNAKAFALRGGSFMSEVTAISEGETALSDRSHALGAASLTSRDSTMTFRLGHGYTYLTYKRNTTYSSYLTLSNGRTTKSGTATDSVCVGDTYTIRGSELLDATGNPVDGGGKTSYLWYRQENNSSEWRIIPNENGRDLVLTDIWSDRQNVNNNERFQYFYVRRMAFAPNGAFHVSNSVLIYRINPRFTFNRLADTIRADNSALGFVVNTGLETTMSWHWKAAGADGSNLPLQYSTSSVNWYVPKRSDFNDIAGQTHVVICEMDFFRKCPRRQEVTVHVEKRPVVGVASNDITMGGSDPSKECGVVMQDMRTQSASRLYKTVKIGNQCWMAENLRYDGAGMSAYSGLKNDDPSGDKYGRLYKYNATVVNNACPSGWRLPTRAEVQVLVNNLGGDNYAGRKAKAANYWSYRAGIEQENSSGFSALGVTHAINTPHEGSYFYMVTSDNYYFRMDSDNNYFRYVSSWGSSYMTIRCIKR